MTHDPSAFIQEYFRGRLDDTEGIDAAFTGPAENTNFSIATGVLFRLRFKVRETATGSDTTGFKIQVNREAGGFVDLNIAPDTGVAPAGVVVLSAQYANGDAINTERLTGTSTFVAGEGLESSITSKSFTLSNQETEIEYCLMALGFHDGPAQNVVDDELIFRMVEADGTAFTGTYTNPTVTISTETAGYIGGTFVEHPHIIGPFVDGNGNLYTGIEHSTTDNNVVIIKSTDDGVTWREGNVSRPATKDFEGVSIVQVADTLHILQSRSDVRYHTYRMSSHASPDTWDIKDEIVDSTITAHSVQACSLHYRSNDATLVAFYVDDVTDARIRYNIRNGTWGGSSDWDTAASIDFISPFGVLGEDDKIHIIYKDDTNGVLYHQSLSKTDVKGTRHSLVTGLPVAGGTNAILQVNPTYYDDAGVEVIMAMYKKVGTDAVIFATPIKDDGTPGTEVQATTTNVESQEGGNAMAIATADVDGKRIYLFWSAGNDDPYDIYRTDNDDEGGWSTDAEEQDAVTAHWISGRVIVEGSGDTVFGYFWDDGSAGGTGFVKYDTFLISAAAAGTIDTDTVVLQAINRASVF